LFLKGALYNEKNRGENMEKDIQISVNGKKTNIRTDPDRMLLWILRSDLGLTGAKHSCGEGFCGACTVLVDGEPVLSCQYPLGDADGKTILTIEGLAEENNLHPLQESFLRHNALQCGFCTPGMILRSYHLVNKNPNPSRKEIIDALEGHLCRCGAYDRIIKAVQSAARAVNKGEGS
jgi:aerobic-type carbon monoxide dehydrogenase small subunit (CoxS/CutS family)